MLETLKTFAFKFKGRACQPGVSPGVSQVSGEREFLGPLVCCSEAFEAVGVSPTRGAAHAEFQWWFLAFSFYLVTFYCFI